MPKAYVLTLTWFSIIRESKEQSSYEQHASYYEQSRTEDFFYFILEEDSNDANRNHGDYNIKRILGLLVHLELKESFQNPVDLFPKYYQSTHDCCYVHQDSKTQISLTVNTKQIGTNSQMTATTNWQIFCKSLNKT